MATIVYSPAAIAHLERLFEYLAEKNPSSAMDAVTAIRSAVELLGQHPLIGRAVEGELRELVISYGKTGYVALYRFVLSDDEVRVLGFRHQRALDYPG